MEQTVKRRGIKHIWHFTRMENLNSILRDGIVPRATLEQRGTQSVFNDSYRIDGRRDASCFSIYHPNYKMFFSLRNQNQEARWVVIACHADVLWLKRCAFCHENAASSSVTQIPIENRQGVDAFERLFQSIEGKPSRQELKLPDSCPTNPQAEVLVFDIVEPRLVAGIVCQDAATEAILKEQHSNFKVLYHRALFSARGDYAHWR